jgi:hypothetical protein
MFRIVAAGAECAPRKSPNSIQLRSAAADFIWEMIADVCGLSVPSMEPSRRTCVNE